VTQVKGYQIPAGAEDVMDDYAGRAAFKKSTFKGKSEPLQEKEKAMEHTYLIPYGKLM